MTELQEHINTHHREIIAMTLDPFLELMKDQRETMTQTTWLKAVRTLMFRIIESPDQYLPKDLAWSESTTAIVRSVFHEFILAHTPFQLSKRIS